MKPIAAVLGATAVVLSPIAVGVSAATFAILTARNGGSAGLLWRIVDTEAVAMQLVPFAALALGFYAKWRRIPRHSVARRPMTVALWLALVTMLMETALVYFGVTYDLCAGGRRPGAQFAWLAPWFLPCATAPSAVVAGAAGWLASSCRPGVARHNAPADDCSNNALKESDARCPASGGTRLSPDDNQEGAR